MILHTVNKSPLSHNALDRCLDVLGADDAVLLIEDGVYAALETKHTNARLQVLIDSGRIFALAEDVQARGLQARVMPKVVEVNYAGFVDLVVKYETSMAWL